VGKAIGVLCAPKPLEVRLDEGGYYLVKVTGNAGRYTLRNGIGGSTPHIPEKEHDRLYVVLHPGDPIDHTRSGSGNKGSGDLSGSKIPPFGREEFSTNLIMPEPCPFLSRKLRRCFIIRPTETVLPDLVGCDSNESLEARIRTARGTITVPIFSYPDGRRFHFNDPSGNELGLIQKGVKIH
jgi:hypothetical protein